MKIKFLIFSFIIISGCIYKKNISMDELEKNEQTYLNLKQNYASCSGRGEVQAEGILPWKLKFKYISQRDSSFIQVMDILGRKSVLIWLTADSLMAWSMIENKKYSHYQMINDFPFLNNFSPSDITKILWGVKPDFLNKSISQLNYSFKYKSLNNKNNFLTSAILSNRKHNQSLIINFHDREHNHQSVDLNARWRLIQS